MGQRSRGRYEQRGTECHDLTCRDQEHGHAGTHYDFWNFRSNASLGFEEGRRIVERVRLMTRQALLYARGALPGDHFVHHFKCIIYWLGGAW